VLIRPDIVQKVGLPIHTLHTPEPVDVAIKNGKEKQKCILKEFVILGITSIDQQWSSKHIQAIIALNLCMPLILSIPFLSHNNIVTDHALRSCVDKKSGYNLIDPKIVLPLPPKALPMTKRKESKKNIKNYLKELKEVCSQRLGKIENSFEKISKINYIGAIKSRLETLSLEETLSNEEKKIREEFKDLFKPTPHVIDLPTDFMAEIKLKDPTMTVKNRSYPCLWKYCGAWQTLLNQHLASGRICPSSSPHASPAFIVPKSNPTALPHWVNNYRQLNSNTMIDSHPLPQVDDILNDCAKGSFFSTIDMTNSFFQTRMKPEDIHLTAVSTPFGLYEWTVMPMGLRNAPSIHQR
jgi:hypothetical protein